MHDDQPYRIFLAILFVAGISMSIFFRRRAARAGGEMEGRPEGLAMALGLRLPAMVGLLTIIAFMINPQVMAWSQLDLPPWVRWTGGAIAAAGHVGIFWMMRHLGTNLTSSVGTRHHHTLVTTGPYRWIRHPLYSFGLISFAGITLMTASWLVALCYTVGFAMLGLRTRIEEANLLDRFGDEYRRYMERTGRYLPVARR